MNETLVRGEAGDVMNAVWSRTPLETVEGIALAVFGIEGNASSLSSERDETFLLRAVDGRRYVLKIANSAERLDVLQFQTEAMLHLERNAPELPVSRVIPTRDGRHIYPLALPEQGLRLVRMLTFLDGEQLYKAPSSELQATNLGVTLAKLGLGLKDFRSPVPDNVLLWDLTHVLGLREHIPDVDLAHRTLVANALNNYEAKIVSGFEALPAQVIHNDFNPHNILVGKHDADAVTGIIDFGDIVHAPLVNDLAVALSYHVGKANGATMVDAFLRGYNSIRPLQAMELEYLPALIKARLAMTVIITEWRAAMHPDNAAYILRNHPVALAGLRLLAGQTDTDMTSRFRSALGDF